MMRSTIQRGVGGVLAATLATAAAAAAAHPTPRPAARCSLLPPLTLPTVRPSEPAFLGRATGDTVLAGAGTVEYGIEAGHFGQPRGGTPIHGQVMEVERTAPWLADSVAAMVREGSGRVVLVPWDYAADCRTVPWAQSARWVPAATSGLFTGRLRDRAHWVDGLPTLDVFAPQFVPYTGTARDRSAYGWLGAGADTTLPWLTPDELLAVRATLPTEEALAAGLGDALAPLRAWAAAHPALAERQPARELLRVAAAMEEGMRFRRRPVPLAGTYRVTVWLAGAGGGAGDSRTFFVRTEDRPASPISGPDGIAGMYVSACAGATERALPVVRLPSGCGRGGVADGDLTEGYLAFGDSAWADGAGGTVRAGSMDVAHGDSVFRARQERLTSDHLLAAPGDDPLRFLPGRFTAGADGGVTFAWTLGAGAAPRLRIVATRVSTVTIGRRAAPR